MRSARGVAASVHFLVALPLAVLGQLLFSVEPEAALHLVFAAGFLLLGLAFSDFAIPAWGRALGGAAAVTLAGIFLAQGVSQLTDNEGLRALAFEVLGQTVETLLINAVVVAFLLVLLRDSHGLSRVLGIAALAMVLGMELYAFVLPAVGVTPGAEPFNVKVLYLLPFVWLLLESGKGRSPQALPLQERLA
jgi:hypothetical protein